MNKMIWNKLYERNKINKHFCCYYFSDTIHKKYNNIKKNIFDNDRFVNIYSESYKTFKQNKINNFVSNHYEYCKVYFPLLKFKNILKHKYIYSKYDFDSSLDMTPFSEYDSKYIFTIVQYKTIYRFYIYDLYKILNTAMLSSDYMIIDPKYPRNPFNNINFTHNQIYLIILKCIELNLKMSKVVYDMMKYRMIKSRIVYNNYILLRTNAVKEYIKEIPLDEQINLVNDILYYFSSYNQLFNIQNLIPDYFGSSTYYNKLIRICKPMFINYILLTSFNEENLIQFHRLEIHKKFKQIIKEQPNFWINDEHNNSHNVEQMNTLMYNVGINDTIIQTNTMYNISDFDDEYNNEYLDYINDNDL